MTLFEHKERDMISPERSLLVILYTADQDRLNALEFSDSDVIDFNPLQLAFFFNMKHYFPFLGVNISTIKTL